MEPAVDGALTTLAGTEWRLTALDGVPIDEDGDRLGGASIEFKENQFGGWSGCNSFGGQVPGRRLVVLRRRDRGHAGRALRRRTSVVRSSRGSRLLDVRWVHVDRVRTGGVVHRGEGGRGTCRLPPCRVSAQQHPGSRSAGRRHTQGVEGIFGPAGHAKRVEFVPVAASAGNETEVTLGNTLTAATVPLTPGDWMVRCAGWGDEFGSAEITVVPTPPDPSQRPRRRRLRQAASETLHVSCTDGGAVVSTPLVAVQADGFMSSWTRQADSESSSSIRWMISRFSSGAAAVGVDGEFVRELVPGRWRAGCVVGPQQDRSSVVGWADVRGHRSHPFWMSNHARLRRR